MKMTRKEALEILMRHALTYPPGSEKYPAITSDVLMAVDICNQWWRELEAEDKDKENGYD